MVALLASSSQAPYHSRPRFKICLHGLSFTPLLLLSPKSLSDFSGTPYIALLPVSSLDFNAFMSYGPVPLCHFVTFPPHCGGIFHRQRRQSLPPFLERAKEERDAENCTAARMNPCPTESRNNTYTCRFAATEIPHSEFRLPHRNGIALR